MKPQVEACPNFPAVAVGIVFEAFWMGEIISKIPICFSIIIGPVIFIGKVRFEPMGEGCYFPGLKTQIKADPGTMPFSIVGTVQSVKRTQIRDGLMAVGDV